MKGLVEQGSGAIKEDAIDELKDVILIAVEQCVKHYEIAAWVQCVR